MTAFPGICHYQPFSVSPVLDISPRALSTGMTSFSRNGNQLPKTSSMKAPHILSTPYRVQLQMMENWGLIFPDIYPQPVLCLMNCYYRWTSIHNNRTLNPHARIQTDYNWQDYALNHPENVLPSHILSLQEHIYLL